MEAFLQNLLDNVSMPWLYAFILGLMTAISPCPLATNITATAYISKDVQNRYRVFANGLVYTLGRAISYSSLGFILFFGASKFHVSRFFQSNGERILGPVLLITGILMLDVVRIKGIGFGDVIDKLSKKISLTGPWTALLMGMLFALAFCPYSGVLFFGMLIPLTVSSASGLYLPLVFAIATGLPVIIIAWFIAFSVSEIGFFYNRLKVFELWFRRVVAVIFIIVGVYFIFIFFV